MRPPATMPGTPRVFPFLMAAALLALAYHSQSVAQKTATRTSSAPALVTVDGAPITADDLEFLVVSRGASEDRRDAERESLIEELIDQQLIRAFLKDRKVEVGDEVIDEQAARVRAALAETGEDPDAILKRLGYTEERLRDAIALPLRWQRHVLLAVPPARLREHFERHRPRYDGTRLRTSQIFVRIPPGEDAETATALLNRVREEIASGKLSFADAARKYSEAPSAAAGGDMGFSAHRGGMPPALADAAFALEDGEVSEPVRTKFGVHLITVTERKPGDLSLEDARPAVLEQLSRQLWDETVARQRRTAKIERSAASAR